jgi:hypothetical protein
MTTMVIFKDSLIKFNKDFLLADVRLAKKNVQKKLQTL